MIFWSSKAPAEKIDYAFDFSGLLKPGEAIASRVVEATGVTVDSHSVAGGVVTVWLSGGAHGTVGRVTATVTTDSVPARTFSEVAVVPIGGLPVSLADAKAAQRIEHDDEDVLLAGFLRAAVASVETSTSKNLTPKVKTQLARGFPAGGRAIRLWRGPVREAVTIRFDDGDGVEQTLADYRLVEGAGAELLPAYGASWPSAQSAKGSVRLTYLAGYDPEDLPSELAQAVVMLFGHFNANRESVVTGTIATELPLGVQWLIAPYRAVGLA